MPFFSSRNDRERDNEEDLGDDGKSILLSLIGQLRPGMDLSRVTLPTFVLEPRSMLDRITNFMSHPDLLLVIPRTRDPIDRFVEVCRFYLSGWHIKPPGVKKPLNPVLGENFRTKWVFGNSSEALYIAEQVSHHPPISAYFYFSPQNNIQIDGVLKPRSKFLGNSAGTIMEGVALLKLMNYPGEVYELTQPNMYARGILFGHMRLELGDTSYVRCKKNDLVAEIDFKTKGYFSGTYNVLHGTIMRESTKEVLFEITGKWTQQLFLKNVKTGEKFLLFDATRATPVFGRTRPIEEQEEKESVRLWKDTFDALRRRDYNSATSSKLDIEESEREERKAREANNEVWKPRFFKKIGNEDYIFNLDISTQDTPEGMLRQVENYVRVSGQQDYVKQVNQQPPRQRQQYHHKHHNRAANSARR